MPNPLEVLERVICRLEEGDWRAAASGLLYVAKAGGEISKGIAATMARLVPKFEDGSADLEDKYTLLALLTGYSLSQCIALHLDEERDCVVVEDCDDHSDLQELLRAAVTS